MIGFSNLKKERLLEKGLKRIAKIQNLSQNELKQVEKMHDQSRDELEQIAKIRRIKTMKKCQRKS